MLYNSNSIIDAQEQKFFLYLIHSFKKSIIISMYLFVIYEVLSLVVLPINNNNKQ